MARHGKERVIALVLEPSGLTVALASEGSFGLDSRLSQRGVDLRVVRVRR